MVAVLLLHAGGQRGLRSNNSSRDQARRCAPFSRRPTSASPSRSVSRGSWSIAVSRPSYDFALQTMNDAALRQVARLRPRGHAAVLRVAAARGGHDQVEPAEDHRRRHGLALPRRAEARAEDVRALASSWRGRRDMPIIPEPSPLPGRSDGSRRCGPYRRPDTGSGRATAGDNNVRLPVFAKVSDCQTPMYAAIELLRAEGFTDIQFVSFRHRPGFVGLDRPW